MPAPRLRPCLCAVTAVFCRGVLSRWWFLATTERTSMLARRPEIRLLLGRPPLAKIGETPEPLQAAGRSWERTNGCSCRTNLTTTRPPKQTPRTLNVRQCVRGAVTDRQGGASAALSCELAACRARCACPARSFGGMRYSRGCLPCVLRQETGRIERLSRHFAQDSAAEPAPLRAAGHATPREVPRKWT